MINIRLIDAENTAYLLCSSCGHFGNCETRMNNGGCTAYKILMQDAPSIDVPDKKVGKWIPHPNKEFKEWDVCTACGIGTKRREINDDCITEYGYHYCPHCGAYMRASDNDKTSDKE